MWGGEKDTAAALRGTCVLALVQCADLPRSDTMLHLVDALADADTGVRRDAVLAVEQMAGHDAIYLLRLTARLGDKSEVTGQAFESLLRLDPGSCMDWVGTFLKSENEQVAEEAALALGASRLPAALETLKATWKESKNRALGPVLLRAISASRSEEALEFLLAIVREGRPSEAQDALRALEIHCDSDDIRRRIEEALARMSRKS